MKKKTSVSSGKGTPPIKEKKERTGGKQLWFTSGAFLTVRNEEGGFYLCRAINNIYNTSKVAKVCWLEPKTGRKIKKGGRSRAQSALPVMDNAYELMYQDEVDPASVLMEVDLERRGKTFLLSDEDKEETERLIHVTEDVESGKMNKDDIGDDVEEAIQIDYEPPVKQRKLQAGKSPASRPKADKTATKEKKTRLKKTQSQKERGKKAKKAKEGEEKRQKKKEAAEERKRKQLKKEDDTALHPNPAVKIMEKDPLWETDCGSVLTQHGADLKSPVVLSTDGEQPATKDKLPPEWKWKPLAVEKTIETEQEVPPFQMAVKNSQFDVALRLLSTTIKGSAEVCAVREQKRNLLHVLAVYARPSNCEYIQIEVAQTLIDKGVPANAKDTFNCTPLFYAAYNGNWCLAHFFAKLPGLMDVKAVDSFHRNLVGASMWKSCLSGMPYGLWDWLATLIYKKVDINKTFDFPMILDVFGSKEIMDNRPHPDYLQHYPGCQTTALIFALHYKDFNFIKNLLVSGADPNLADGNSLTPLIHAVKLNAVAQVKQLLKYDYCPATDDQEPVPPQSKQQKKKQSAYYPVKKTSSVNLNATDSHGWTALHYVACPLELGSFDNEEIVFVLGKAGAKLDVKNSKGQTPLDLALTNGSPKVAAMLQTLMGIDKNVQKQPVFPPADHRVDDGVNRCFSYDFFSDADKQTVGGEEEMEEDKAFEPGVFPDCLLTNATFVRDEDQDLPYEVLMTKCDTKLAEWAIYNFYNLQLVHQLDQNRYVLHKSWGCIGMPCKYKGMPYASKEDGVKEFCRIFRQKSGNNWEDVKNFEQKPKKYHLVPVEYRRLPRKQKQVEFDFSTKTKCTLRADVRKAMEIMVNVEEFQKGYGNHIYIDTKALPFGRIYHERLLPAKLLLEDMSVFVNNIAEYRKDIKEKTAEEKQQHQEDCQKVFQLSSEYYQLIPSHRMYEQQRPLDQIWIFQSHFRYLINLLDIEVSTKMMLGAMYRKTDVHPLDYVYSVMKCKLELMEEEDPMTQYILRYAQIGSNNRYRFEAVYKVQREGEDVRFQKCGLDNHRLLWHETSTNNLISILNRGLIPVPLDASLTGDCFRKGICFSDMFDKSAYPDRSNRTSNFMLLCEVALGKQRHIDTTLNERGDDYNSSVTLGRNIPNPNYDIRLPSGEIMSMGDAITQYTYVGADGNQHYRRADHTEYIVYHEDQVCIRYLLQYRLR